MPTLFANNVAISSILVTNDSILTFDISWENSWRTNSAPDNHDAVWIFIKKRDCASLQWSHVNLSPTVGNHSAASPLEVYIDGKDGTTEAKGIFLRRSSNGSGAIAPTNVSIRMTGLSADEYDFQVYGIEMVQIPQGSFYVGDGNHATGSFIQGGTNDPYLISSENSISVSSSGLYTSSSTYRPLSMPADYPKGYNEIYAMKYEISQGQYTAFVNTLNADQAAIRSITGTASRLNITGAWSTHTANTPHRAMNYLGWADFLAYLDWSALRPMTELEFEKIARGPLSPVANEYAWGTTSIVDANSLVLDGTPSETASNAITAGAGIANYNNNTVFGPLRNGFAAKPGTNRHQSGSSYYGVMELSGNLWEFTITTRNSTGTSFQATLGDGEISKTPSPGFADVLSWPSPQASIASTTSAIGQAKRGGSWNESSVNLRVSDRANVNSNEGRRLNEFGGRGVR